MLLGGVGGLGSLGFLGGFIGLRLLGGFLSKENVDVNIKSFILVWFSRL